MPDAPETTDHTKAQCARSVASSAGRNKPLWSLKTASPWLLTQLLLIQNHFQTLVHIPAHFAKAVFLVEPLGRNL
jgi:hypothetical protein